MSESEIEKQEDEKELKIIPPSLDERLTGSRGIIVPSAEEQMKEDKELKKILEKKREKGLSFSYPTHDMLEEKTEGTIAKAKEHYRDIPSIDAISVDDISDIADRMEMLEKEYNLFNALKIEDSLLEKLEQSNLITEAEMWRYRYKQEEISETLKYKLNPKSKPSLKNYLLTGAGAGAGLGSIPGIIMALGGVLDPIFLFATLIGTGAGTVLTYLTYEDEKEKINMMDKKNLGEVYTKFLEALNPIKEVIEGKRTVDETKKPRTAQIIKKTVDEIKYKVEQLYKLASTKK